MKIRAQSLLNSCKWVERYHSKVALENVLAACHPEVIERFETGINIEWHPREELINFLKIAEQQLGDENGRLCQEMGHFSASENTRGLLKRAVFYLAQPEFLMKRITNLWSHYNEQGMMRLNHFEAEQFELQLLNVNVQEHHGCSFITGWMSTMSAAMGFENPSVQHVQCRSRGDNCCIWRGVSVAKPSRRIR